MSRRDLDFEVAYANVMTCHGVEPSLVDVAVTRAPTQPWVPPEHVFEEMRRAALQDRAQSAARAPGSR